MEEEFGENPSAGVRKVEKIAQGKARDEVEQEEEELENGQLKRLLRLERERSERAEREKNEQSIHHQREVEALRKKRGVGAWIAAVSVLGASTLALLTTTIVLGNQTANLKETIAATYRADLYEMAELSQSLSSNLNQLRVATSGGQQRRLLEEVLVDSRLLESRLERVPTSPEASEKLYALLNETAQFAQEGLSGVSLGGALAPEYRHSVDYVYNANQHLLQGLYALRDDMGQDDWRNVGKADGKLLQGMEEIGNVPPPPTGTDEIFSPVRRKVTAHGLQDLPTISKAEGEKIVGELFQDYSLSEVSYRGEALAETVPCYNYTATDERGRKLYAQLSKAGGKLILFDWFEDCSAENFTTEQCIEKAKEFLEGLQFENMTPVWVKEKGACVLVNYAYQQGEVPCYADMVAVKVCKTKGKVIGLEGLSYYLNHGQREIADPAITREQALSAVEDMTVSSVRRVMAVVDGREVQCYELAGEKDGQEYLCYVDVSNGEQVKAIALTDQNAGRFLA